MEPDFPTSALSYLEPQSGGYWCVESQEGTTSHVSYVTIYGNKVPATVERCTTEDDVLKHCGSFLYNLPPVHELAPPAFPPDFPDSVVHNSSRFDEQAIQLVNPPEGFTMPSTNSSFSLAQTLHPSAGFVSLSEPNAISSSDLGGHGPQLPISPDASEITLPTEQQICITSDNCVPLDAQQFDLTTTDEVYADDMEQFSSPTNGNNYMFGFEQGLTTDLGSTQFFESQAQQDFTIQDTLCEDTSFLEWDLDSLQVNSSVVAV